MNRFDETDHTILRHIHEGMTVYDSNENKIGTVSYIQMTDEDPSQPGPETAAPSKATDPYDDSLVENIAEVFAGDDDLPKEIRRKLLREGYIRVDTGLLRADRFVTPDQISSVSDENVYLSVAGDDALHR